MGESNLDTLNTGVDRFIEYLKTVDIVSLKDVAKKLNVSLSVVENWVDFLVDENIVGLEYKFTEPFVYLNKSKSDNGVNNVLSLNTLSDFKNNFFREKRLKGLTDAKILEEWKNYLESFIAAEEDYFKAKAKEFAVLDVDNAWKKYRSNLGLK